jgi:cation transport regulator
MPYNSTTDLPENVREHLPEHAQEIFMETYNSAWKAYSNPSKRRGGESQEETAFRVAWAAVKHEFEKDDKTGQWKPKKNEKQNK